MNNIVMLCITIPEPNKYLNCRAKSLLLSWYAALFVLVHRPADVLLCVAKQLALLVQALQFFHAFVVIT